MTVADIIAAARQYTQITGSAWFTPADELRSVNRSYRDVYEKIVDSNDEYFITEVLVPLSALTLVRDHVYEYTLPSDWYRLRNLRGLNGRGENVFERLDPQSINQVEGYRYFNNKLRITMAGDYDNLRIEYYPAPVEYASVSNDIAYPPQLEPLILAYSVAIDIAKAGGSDPAKYVEEYMRLWQRFAHATERRDNLRYPRISNVYRSTYPGW